MDSVKSFMVEISHVLLCGNVDVKRVAGFSVNGSDCRILKRRETETCTFTSEDRS